MHKIMIGNNIILLDIACKKKKQLVLTLALGLLLIQPYDTTYFF